MLEPAEEGHSEKCGHLNFPSMSLVPAVGWAALPPEPHRQLPLVLVPQAPCGTSAEWRGAGMAWRLSSCAASCVLAEEQVGWAHGWEPHAAPWSWLGCLTDPVLLPRWRVWLPCRWRVMATWDKYCLGSAYRPGAMAWPRGLSSWSQAKSEGLGISVIKRERSSWQRFLVAGVHIC